MNSADDPRLQLLRELLLERNHKPSPPLAPGDSEALRAERRRALARDWRDFDEEKTR